MLEQAFIRAVQEHVLIPEGSTVIVGVSGGSDSLALLHLLKSHAQQLNIRVQVAMLDHGLRPESALEYETLRLLSNEWGLPITVKKVNVTDVASREKISIETAGRNARYDFFAAVARQVRLPIVAVAHHADDQAETILMACHSWYGCQWTAGDGCSITCPGVV